MKTNLASGTKSFTTFLAGLLLAAVPSLCQAAPKPPSSPAGTNGFFTWDCLSSGAGQPGIAFLTFSSNYTFTGDLIVAGTPASTNNNSRNSGSTGRGGSTTGANSGTTTNINLFGYWGVEGPWGYDIKGRIIGTFIQIIQVAPQVTINWNTITVDTGPIPFWVSDYDTDLITQTQTVSFFVDSSDGSQGYLDTTNFVRTFVGPSSTRTYTWTAIHMPDGGYTNSYTTNLTFFNATNYIYQTSTNFTYTFAAADLTTNITWSVTGPNGYVNHYSLPFSATNTLGYGMTGVVTNHVSFVGTVVPNKRLTLVASTSLGGNHLTYTGVPMNTNKLTNISGHWTGTKLENKVSYIEFFDVTPSSSPYLFFVDGKGILAGGAGYDVNGLVMISSQKQIAFAESEQQWGATNDVLRASTGPLSVSKKAVTAKTKGLDDTSSSLNFNATLALP